jgi:hypothetical protein
MSAIALHLTHGDTPQGQLRFCLSPRPDSKSNNFLKLVMEVPARTVQLLRWAPHP